MTKFNWTPEADALLIWVAGGVWCHEKRTREGKLMIDHIYLFEQVADFLDALNEFEPFEKSGKRLNAQIVGRRATLKRIQWEKPQWVKRPSWLSEENLKGQFGEVGLKALHESTLRLRCDLGNTAEWYEMVRKWKKIFQRQEWYTAQNKEFLQQEEKAAQRPEKAQRKRLWREEEGKIREQEFRSGVKKLGYTKDADSSGDLSWADPSASGFHYREPKSDSHVGAFRRGAKDGCLSPPLQLKTTSTAQR
ncbi:hypothetical protein BPAE_0024g00720 [Botrytis paeoniae]|uniref:Uncharacterized protein n=1 Tax=Botrytis paeoniae TaxID=278948 RepID=A0A4Z1FV77_9HELO|nr:hypothetical protein BPAE_0024g00720 [Botrytis paeoniae]